MTDEFYVAAVRIQMISTTVTYHFFFFQEAPKLNIDICQSESCEKMTLLKSLVRLIQSI